MTPNPTTNTTTSDRTFTVAKQGVLCPDGGEVTRRQDSDSGSQNTNEDDAGDDSDGSADAGGVEDVSENATLTMLHGALRALETTVFDAPLIAPEEWKQIASDTDRGEDTKQAVVNKRLALLADEVYGKVPFPPDESGIATEYSPSVFAAFRALALAGFLGDDADPADATTDLRAAVESETPRTHLLDKLWSAVDADDTITIPPTDTGPADGQNVGADSGEPLETDGGAISLNALLDRIEERVRNLRDDDVEEEQGLPHPTPSGGHPSVMDSEHPANPTPTENKTEQKQSRTRKAGVNYAGSRSQQGQEQLSSGDPESDYIRIVSNLAGDHGPHVAFQDVDVAYRAASAEPPNQYDGQCSCDCHGNDGDADADYVRIASNLAGDHGPDIALRNRTNCR
jgi:hypothetical protein